MSRVISGLVLNKAGSKNVNYCLMFCFATYSHQEKWNNSESPEYKWERICSIALSYFGYARKKKHKPFSDCTSVLLNQCPCETWCQCHPWTCLQSTQFSRELREQKKLNWGIIPLSEQSYQFHLLISITAWTLERNIRAKHFLASIALMQFYLPSTFSLRSCVRHFSPLFFRCKYLQT